MITYMFDPEKPYHVLDPKTKQFIASTDSHTEAACYAQKKSAERNISYLVMETKEKAVPERVANLQKFRPVSAQGLL